MKTINAERMKHFLSSKTFFYGLVAFSSAFAFCMIYGVRVLNPKYVDWLMTGGDLSQHYLGWMSFRNSDWLFPIGMSDQLSYPVPTSVIFTDSIPAFAILFKLLKDFLPANFQYFGLWGILCFVLQGILAAKILGLFAVKKSRAFIGSLFFVLSPMVIQRMYAHTSLAGHWLILFSLYLLLCPEIPLKKSIPAWCAVGILSPSVHTYFLGMNGIILLGFCLKSFLTTRSLKHSLIPLAAYILSSLATVFLLGGFSTKTATAYSSGLGFFSMNLNALFNPQGFSVFLKDLPHGGGQYEGFAYLGLGIMLLLLFLAFNATFGGKSAGIWKKELVRAIPLIMVFAMSFAFALSNIVMLNDKTLLEIPLGKAMENIWGTFRSTGRFSWVCVYLLYILALSKTEGLPQGKRLTAFLAAMLLVQCSDLSGILQNKRSYFSERRQYSPEISHIDGWNRIFENENIRHICLSPELGRDDSLAVRALKSKKTLNRYYFAHGNIDFLNQKFTSDMKNPRQDTIYLFNSTASEIEKYCDARTFHFYTLGLYTIASLDELPEMRRFYRCLFLDSKKFNASGLLVSGFSHQEEWGTWTDGKCAVLKIPVSGSLLPNPLKVKITCAPFNNSQKIRIYAGETSVWSGEFTSQMAEIEFSIDTATAEESVTIKIETPDAFSPKSLGQSSDERNLSLGIQKIELLD